MRKQLEKLQVGSRLNTLAAMDNRAEMARYLANAQEQGSGAQRDLAQSWPSGTASSNSGMPTLPTNCRRR